MKTIEELEQTQRQSVVDKFCKNCVYYFGVSGCQNQNNNTGDVIAECPYYQRIQSISVET